ncbi:MAG: gluconokinase [Janthinobacterium lividum]
MIVVLMGVSGSGKTTIGQMLAARLECDFADADDFHSAANQQKMHAGIALTDADRQPWLEAIRAAIDQAIADGRRCVLGCSALKRSYRDFLRASQRPVTLVYLACSEPVLRERLAKRRGHFFPPSLLDSQIQTLEEPGADEALIVDADPAPEKVVAAILSALAKLR